MGAQVSNHTILANALTLFLENEIEGLKEMRRLILCPIIKQFTPLQKVAGNEVKFVAANHNINK